MRSGSSPGYPRGPEPGGDPPEPRSEALIDHLARASADVARHINLYAMMKYNHQVWDFMTTVIGEKYRTQELDCSRKDLNTFFFRPQEQNDTVAGWSDVTVERIKQVLTKALVVCEYLYSHKSAELNPVFLCPELKDEGLDISKAASSTRRVGFY